jgi:stage II sporulation protein Q
MKEKVKQFFVEKKELLIFIGVLAFVFTAVMIISSIALKKEDSPIDGGPDPIISDNDNDVIEPTQPEEVKITFGYPAAEGVDIIRVYYDASKGTDALKTAIILNDNKAYESTGVTYHQANDEAFDVYAVYDGKVTGISKSDVYGTIVEITHDNNVVSYYSSLASTSLKLNDEVKKGNTVGVAGNNIFDDQSSVHMTFEVKVNGKYVDPEKAFGLTLEEVSKLEDTKIEK